MKKFAVVCLVIGVTVLSLSSIQADVSDQVKMPATPIPSIKNVIGQGPAELGPSRYPEFYAFQSDNPTCGEKLKKHHKNGGISFSPLPGYDLANPVFTTIPEMAITNFRIPAQFRENSKLLITWTVRIIGDYPDSGGFLIDSKFGSDCSVWHGTSYQKFLGGTVTTKVVVNNTSFGEAKMTVPDGGTVAINQPLPPPPSSWSCDPTVSGSVVVIKEDFGGEFPDLLNIDVRWLNDTSLKVKTLPKQRNLSITILPG